MKRISVNIFLTYANLFKDLIAWEQVDPYESERDLNRIVSLCETRGERSIFIDFPSCAKSVDNALSNGELDTRKLAILGTSTKNGLPGFMNSTFSRVFDSQGKLLREPDIGAVMAIRQVLLLYKKVEIPCTEEKICEAVVAFFRTDDSLRDYRHPADDGSRESPVSFVDALWTERDGGLPGLESSELPQALVKLSQRVCDQVVQRFHLFQPENLVGNHGRGAVADLKGGLDKYQFPFWDQRLERVFPRDLHSSANVRLYEYGSGDESGSGETLWSQRVGSSYAANGLEDRLDSHPARLHPVNKTQEKPRLIAIEPTANQFIQGGLRKFLRKMIDAGVLGASINIRNQSLSRELAVLASQDSTLSTVDLSDASDRLSCWTVQRALRKAPALLEALFAARSEYIRDPKFTKTYARMRKYAPQGNATVFPLQSIVYCCMSYAAVIWSSPTLKIRSDADLWSSIKEVSSMVRVYGDDIILPTHALPALSSLLELCQLKVNGAKSHYSGRYAESCGVDAFMGTDVTPVYIHSVEDEVQPGNVQSMIDVSNNCYRKGLLHLGNLVESRIPEHITLQLVKTRLPGPTSFLFTYSHGYLAARTRYNRDLHRYEMRTLVSAYKTERAERNSWDSLFQYFTERPDPLSKWKSGWDTRGRTKLVRQWVPYAG